MALSLENNPKLKPRNTPNGMAQIGNRNADSASNTPSPPSTSAMPTTPVTASVITALATNTAPASQLVRRSRVSDNIRPATSAAFSAWPTTFTQWCRNGNLLRFQSSRQTMFGIGR